MAFSRSLTFMISVFRRFLPYPVCPTHLHDCLTKSPFLNPYRPNYYRYARGYIRYDLAHDRFLGTRMVWRMAMVLVLAFHDPSP